MRNFLLLNPRWAAFLLALLASAFGFDASAQTWSWATRTSGTGELVFTNTTVDAAGNTYVAGRFSGTVTCGTTTLTSAGGWDLLVGKISATGQWVWAKRGGRTGALDVAYGIAVDRTGNVYVGGEMPAGTYTFDALTLTVASVGCPRYAFLGKLSATGQWQWVKSSATGSSIHDLTIDASGNLCAVGWSRSSVTLGAGNPPSPYADYAFASKVSPAGVVLWENIAAVRGWADDVTVDRYGNFYVSGQGSGAATIGPSVLPGLGASDGFVAKISAAGQWQWGQRIGSNSYDGVTDVAVDATGNVYVTAQLYGAATIAGTAFAARTAGYGVVAKCSPTGQWLWAAGSVPVTATDSHFPATLAIDGSNSLHVMGSNQGQNRFGATLITTPAYLARLNAADGTWQWAQGVTLSGNQGAIYSLATGPAGALWMGAYYTTAFRLGTIPLADNGTVAAGLLGKMTFAAPTISSFSVPSATAGTTIALNGTNLNTTSSVRFGTQVASYAVVSGTRLNVLVPPGATTGVVSITTTGGGATSPTAFTVVPPTASSFTPLTGLVGTTVTLTGTGFTGATGVRFNGVNAPSFSVTSAVRLTAVVPVGATTGKISVLAAGGAVLTTANFTVVLPPTITSFTPASGGAGTIVTITGTNLTGITAAKFNLTASAVVTPVSATSVKLTVPSNATTGKISLTTVAGTVNSVGNFTRIQAPTITSFTPASGGTGTVVTVTGTNLIGVTAAKFNLTAVVTITPVSATSVRLTVPAGATTGKISLTTAGGTAISVGNFTKTGARAVAIAANSTAAPTGLASTLLDDVTIDMYPNPAHGQVQIEMAPQSISRSVLVFNALGQQVLAGQLPAHSTGAALPLARLVPGVYTVRCGRASRRLVVE